MTTTTTTTPTPPTDLPTILYFGNDWMAENRTSSHHVARWLAKPRPASE